MTGCLVSPGQDHGHSCLWSLLLLPTQGPLPKATPRCVPLWGGWEPGLSLSDGKSHNCAWRDTVVMTEIPPLPPTQRDPPPVAHLREGALLSHTSTLPHSPERAGAGSVPPYGGPKSRRYRVLKTFWGSRTVL